MSWFLKLWVVFCLTVFVAGVVTFAVAHAATIEGTSRGDYLIGTGGRDVIYGYGGDDTIKGRSGADDLYGGSQSDYIEGGYGLDVISGGTGNDTLRSDDGTIGDVIYCGGGDADTARIDLGDETHGCEFVGGIG